VSTVYVRWGDGSPPARIRRTTASHVYKRIRAYTITLTITDRAGNRTVITHKVKIKTKAKPKKKKKKKKGKTSHTARAQGPLGAQLTVSLPGDGSR
jgi:PKD repeat protein